MTRVLHVLYSAYPDVTGASIRSRYLAEAQAELGVAPIVVSSPFQKPADPGQSQGVELVNDIRYFRSFDPGYDHRFMEPRKSLATRAKKLTALAPFTLRVRRIARAERVDLIHGHSLFFCGLASVLAARGLGIPSIYEVRSLIEDTLVQEGGASERSLVYRAYRRLDDLACRFATHVIAISEGLRGDLIARGVPPGRVSVVGNGVDVAKQPPAVVRDARLQAELGFPPDAFVLGYIGTLFEYEGLDFLIDAVAAAARELPKLRVLIVGNGHARERLVALVRERGMGDRITLVPGVSHEEVGRYYGLVDLFVLPRRPNRLTNLVTPLKPLEIMARGKAVLASDCGGHRELLRDGENGLLFQAGVEASLVQRIRECCAEPAALLDLGRRARAWVETHRTWRMSAEASIAVYDRLLRRGSERTAPRSEAA